ncbi:Hint domain-containing protein [Palleronia caenipelagi]|uniref:Hint domain-containing protein n=1 Tax=Palleronia caenipelagi TaxID=2489174 RepID=A0A547PKM1_9RHOB|nr:Hint domain-containing protein [Palleronia caenipelagi]TRD14702.1 Hint domain-containing protein [Palleronia caenipelagi]
MSDILSTSQVNDTGTIGFQSPPVLLKLDDGRILHVWTDDGLGDTTSAFVYGRLQNPDGTWVDTQFQIGSASIDGTDGYDVPQLEVQQLSGGNVIVSFERANGDPAGTDTPIFTILDPSLTQADAGFEVATDVEIPSTVDIPFESPAQLTTLSDGRVIAVWSRNGLNDDTTMDLYARFINPDGTFSGGEFQVGTVAVDGTDAFDVPNFEVTEFGDLSGNIMVGLVRNGGETGGSEPVYSIIDSTGTPVVSDQEMQTVDPVGTEGPPKLLTLNDGRVLAVWKTNALADDGTNQLVGRIFNSDGTAGDQFNIGTLFVDGFDAQDVDNFDIAQSTNGNVMVAYVQATQEYGTDLPVFTMFNPSLAPTDPAFIVAEDQYINEFNTTSFEAAPKITALDNGGFFALWSRSVDDGNLVGRFFDPDGNPIDGEIDFSTQGTGWQAEGAGGFDIDNYDVVANTGYNVTVGWVGNDAGSVDGSGTTVLTATAEAGADALATTDPTPGLVNQDTVGFQSPPQSILLDDGRILHVWSNDGLSDGTTSLMQGRIQNADGTWATDQFQIGAASIDGTDGYDVPQFNVELFGDGKVAVTYLRANGDPAGTDTPILTILDTALASTDPGFEIVSDAEIPSTVDTNFESPAQLEELADGRIIAVWSRNGLSDDGTMDLYGRFINSDGTFTGTEFQIGTVAVDGTDGFDVPNFDVEQFTDGSGNIMVGLVQNGVEAGGSAPVYSVIDTTGAAVATDLQMQDVNPVGIEGPPKMVALPDGRIMAVWKTNALSDDGPATMEGRIFNSDGTPSTDQFTIGTIGVDGFDPQDVDIFDLAVSSDGNVMIAYSQTSAAPGSDLPIYSIINPSLAPTDPAFVVAQDQYVFEYDGAGFNGSPQITALDNGGYFIVASRNLDGGDLVGHYVDAAGNLVGGEINFSDISGGYQVEGLDGFDVENYEVVPLSGYNVVVSWVGNDASSVDGSGTSVLVSNATAAPVCFARETRIQTPDGWVQVEDLSVGDLVVTRDNGIKPIQWIGRRTVAAVGNFAPILFKAGTIGNTRDLRVSPQHRVLRSGWALEMLFGVDQALVPAKSMVDGKNVLILEGGEIEYYHIMFDQHEVICSEGAWTESFLPGPEAINSVDRAARQELLTLFPELMGTLRTGEFAWAPAQPLLTVKESQLLVGAD